jgi:hypothetical protein
MAKADGVLIFIGTYPDEASARYDYDLVKDLHAAGAVGTYDAAVITKGRSREGARQQEPDGHPAPSLRRRSRRGRHRHLVTALDHRHRPGRGAVGGVSGHLWQGMSWADVKELGDSIDEGIRPRHRRGKQA